jgi:flagellar hook-associated protein 2
MGQTGIRQDVEGIMSSGVSFSGLSSGIDTATIIQQLIAIERRPITLLENQQVREENKRTILQEINTSLLAAKTSVEALSSPEGFDLFDVSSSDEAVVGVGSTGAATSGSFSVEVLGLAQAQTRSSKSFSSSTDALGFAGDILVNGKAVTIASDDSLEDIQSALTDANAGISAQILQVSDTDFRLLITSQTTGIEGFNLLDASATDILQGLGFTGTATSIKNAITGGAQSDQLVSSSTAVGSLLGTGESPSGSVTIGDKSVSIDLTTDSLQDIKDKIDAAGPAGVTASIVGEEAADGSTVFRLQIDGTTTLVDDGNVLEALGVLNGAASVDPAVAEVHTGNVANTTNGSTAIDAGTKFSALFGSSVTNSDTITISGTDRTGNSVSGSYTVANINANDIQDLLNEIESVFSNAVTASVDSNGKLVVTDNTAGQSQLSLALSANNEGGGTLNFGTIAVTSEGENATSREVAAGQNASFRVNGVTLSRSSNTVADAIEGVSLSLKKVAVGTKVNIDITEDTSGIRDKLETFVADFNEAMSLISAQFVFDEASQTAGPLSGDSTLLTLQSQLRQVVTSPVEGLPDNENVLTLFGVSFDRQGLLQVDSQKLDESLTTNFAAFKKVMVANGETSDNNIEFIFQTDQTKAGSYSVNITTAPEQAVHSGTTDLTSGLLADESITITDTATNRSETIDLTAGDSIDDIVSRINGALSSNIAEVQTGSIANTTDGTIAVSGSTTFDSVFGAGVVANDTIDIQGNLHNGARVSGSFTISDPTTQSIDDLMAEIRSVFGGSISTTIDSNGQIKITDGQVGTSSLSLTIIERNEGGGSLDFGSLTVTDEGRFNIGVTASNEIGKLKLQSDAYGSSTGFTISQNTGEMGLVDGSYSGVDVVGTINGETTTGSGRVLTGSTDSSNIAGLSVRVNLTPAQLISQGSSQGTVNIVQGIADQIRRSLKSITDPFEGLIASRDGAIEDTLKAAQEQIAALNARVAVKESILSKQFTAMEKAVAQFNSLGSFLGAQLASLPSANSR